MIKTIVRDPLFLARKAPPATIADLPVAADLQDTIMAHAEIPATYWIQLNVA